MTYVMTDMKSPSSSEEQGHPDKKGDRHNSKFQEAFRAPGMLLLISTRGTLLAVRKARAQFEVVLTHARVRCFSISGGGEAAAAEVALD